MAIGPIFQSWRHASRFSARERMVMRKMPTQSIGPILQAWQHLTFFTKHERMLMHEMMKHQMMLNMVGATRRASSSALATPLHLRLDELD